MSFTREHYCARSIECAGFFEERQRDRCLRFAELNKLS